MLPLSRSNEDSHMVSTVTYAVTVTLSNATDLLSVTEAAIKSGCWSGTDEAHTTLTKLGEKRIVDWYFNRKTFRMKKLGVVQEHSLVRTALDAHSVGV